LSREGAFYLSDIRPLAEEEAAAFFRIGGTSMVHAELELVPLDIYYHVTFICSSSPSVV
jgi:hypothetical protein